MSAPATINSQDLNQLLGSPAPPRILDVRTPGEFEVAHVAGAYNVPLDLLREHRDEIIQHLDQDVVLVCRSGQRAAQAEETLQQGRAGQCAHPRGRHHGLGGQRVSRSTAARQRWDLERQVRLVAGSIVLSTILGSIAVPKLKWVAAAIGGGLTFASLTNTCAMGMALAKLPYNRGATCDAQTIVSQLVDSTPAHRKRVDRHDRLNRCPGRVRRDRAGLARRRRLDPDRPTAGLCRRHGRQTGHRHIVARRGCHQRYRRRLARTGRSRAMAHRPDIRWCGHGRCLRRRPAGPIHPGHCPADRIRRHDDRHGHRHAARTQESSSRAAASTACRS